MQNYQDIGFSINITKDFQAVSNNTFLLSTENAYAPNVSIKVENIANNVTLENFVNNQLSTLAGNVNNFKEVKRIQGKQNGRDAEIVAMEWGENETRNYQQLVYIVDAYGSNKKIFVISCNDLRNNISTSLPLMNQLVRSFRVSSTLLEAA